jgi:hypothetical protein
MHLEISGPELYDPVCYLLLVALTELAALCLLETQEAGLRDGLRGFVLMSIFRRLETFGVIDMPLCQKPRQGHHSVTQALVSSRHATTHLNVREAQPFKEAPRRAIVRLHWRSKV